MKGGKRKGGKELGEEDEINWRGKRRKREGAEKRR
jgi:hypothetical protein